MICGLSAAYLNRMVGSYIRASNCAGPSWAICHKKKRTSGHTSVRGRYVLQTQVPGLQLSQEGIHLRVSNLSNPRLRFTHRSTSGPSGLRMQAQKGNPDALEGSRESEGSFPASIYGHPLLLEGHEAPWSFSLSTPGPRCLAFRPSRYAAF